MSFYNFTAVQLAQQIRSKKVSCREVTDAFLERIEDVEPKVHAYITVTETEARKRADTLDKRLASGEDIGPLGGGAHRRQGFVVHQRRAHHLRFQNPR